ncbi:MAG TPA: hypothetical protein VFA07_18405 [Chthonomonadaceae bacterium]|nr:hypothetical protein [Chthonomonadaceae bacterium]
MDDLQRHLNKLKAESSTFAEDYEHIKQQTEAEIAFASLLEAKGIDCERFRKKMNLSVHEFNVLAHFIYGVNDEEPKLSPDVRALLDAVRAADKKQVAA